MEVNDPVPAIELSRPDLMIQRQMNVVVPLKDPTPAGKARLAFMLMTEGGAIVTALRNIGTVHTARFNIVGRNLEFTSLYDGGAQTYLTDFARQIGTGFNAIMAAAKDWPDGKSVSDDPAHFAEFILARDLAQIPEDAAELVRDTVGQLDEQQPDALPLAVLAALEDLFRTKDSANLSSYVAYGEKTVAQIRNALGLDLW